MALRGINIKPGTLLLFPGTGQLGGTITYKFSEPVSNVQIALAAQNSFSGQLTITTTNGNEPVTPTLNIFNRSADGCPDAYQVSENVVYTKSDTNASATIINIGGNYFTSVTIRTHHLLIQENG